MKPSRSKQFLAAIAATMLAATAAAGPLGSADKSIDLPVTVSSTAFSALAMNTARTTDSFNVWGLEYVTFTALLTHDSSTDMSVSCDYSDEATATNWVPVPVWTYTSSTTKTRATKVWYTVTGGDLNWPVVVSVNAYRWLRCTFTASGATANDTMTVTAKGATKGS